MDTTEETESTDRLSPIENFFATLFMIIVTVGLVGSEFLIYYNQEARDDWTRMLPSAIFGPFIMAFALSIACIGIGLLWTFYKSDDWALAPLCLVFIYPGVRMPCYWIQRIVIDKVPAFGYNPDNIYAVTGLNSMALGLLWALEGLAVGGFLAIILRTICRLSAKKVSG